MQHGRVVRGYLGLHGHNIPLAPPLARLYNLMQTACVEVVAVEPDAPAHQAGIEPDDCIVSLGDQEVTSVDDLHKLLTQLPVGVPASVIILRGQRRLQRFVLPEEYPHWDAANR
jgi:S1-C subfamily serine protease